MGFIGNITDAVTEFFSGMEEGAFARAGGGAYVVAGNAVPLLNTGRDPKRLEAQRKALLRPKLGLI